jgi:uncharacterized membrane protein
MAEDNPSRETIERLVARLERLEQVLQANTARLHAVEERLRAATPPPPTPHAAPRRPLYETFKDERDEADTRDEAQTDARGAETDARETQPPPPSSQTPPPSSQTPPPSSQHSSSQHSTPPPFTSQTPPSQAPPPRTPPPRGATAQARGGAGASQRRDLESVVGGSWFAWAGIITITFGIAFALKFAFESELIGPPVRVLLGALGGGALLFVGERLRRKGLRQYAYILSGGGVLILYLSIYAAFAFYGLIGQFPAFVLMAGVTALAVLLAVRLDALPVAVLGLVGGFLTPLLLSTGRDNQVGLFSYVALLDAGVLAVAYFKRWRSLNYLSFLATALMTFGWMAAHYDKSKLWTTLFFLSLFFVLYSALAVVHNLLPRRATRWFDICLLSANATFYFGLSYLLLSDAGYAEGVPASQALVVSAFYAALFYAAWRLNRSDRLLAYSAVGAAVTFFTVALAIKLELHWVTVAWAVEGLMLTWVGLRSGERAPRYAALVVFAAAVLHWFTWDVWEFALRAEGAFVPLLNRRALSCAALVGALAGGVWLYRRAEEVEAREREAAGTLLALAAHALAFTLLTLDLNDYFTRRQLEAARADENFYSTAAARRLHSARMFSISALWTIYGATTLAYGVRRGRVFLRYAGLALLALATLKVLAIDLTFYAEAWRVPVFNQTFTAFALLVAAYGFAARLYARSGKIGEGERAVVPALVVAANLLAVVALSAEAFGYFDSKLAADAGDAARVRDLELAKQLSLSVVWALYGGGLLMAGRVRRSQPLRVMALALLALTTLKVFFWDLSSLDRAYRIVSFIVLGAILLAVSYLYQKSQQREQRAAEAAEGGVE